jgi:hypothetical protein
MPLSLGGQCCCNASPPPAESQRGAGAGAAGGTDRPAAARQTQHTTAGSSEHRRRPDPAGAAPEPGALQTRRRPLRDRALQPVAEALLLARHQRPRPVKVAGELLHQLPAVATALLQPRRGRRCRADGLQAGDHTAAAAEHRTTSRDQVSGQRSEAEHRRTPPEDQLDAAAAGAR